MTKVKQQKVCGNRDPRICTEDRVKTTAQIEKVCQNEFVLSEGLRSCKVH